MNTQRNVGLACGFLALASIACVGLCGLGAAIMAAGTAVGIGQAVEVMIPAEAAAPGLRLRTPEGRIPFERVFDASLTELAESMAGDFVQSSDVVAQALAAAGSRTEVREALELPLEAGAMLGEARFSEDLLMGEASLTLELKGSLATGTLELAAHRGPWTVRSEPVSDGPSLRIPGIGFAIAHSDWVFDKLVVTLPGGGGVIVLAGSH